MKHITPLFFLFITSACLESGDSGSEKAAPSSVVLTSSTNSSESTTSQSAPLSSTGPSLALTKEFVEALSARPVAEVDYQKLDGIVSKGLADVRGGLEAAIGKQEKIDYDRIHSLVLQSVVDNLKPLETPRYQFICDVNERWIYRCNLQTGEIECFSMSSNKLRLISSVR